MTPNNILQNYRLTFWHIKGNFDECSMLDINRETKVLNQKNYQPAFTPRKLFTLEHIITANCFGDTDLNKRVIRVEMITVFETDFNINIENSLNDLAEIGYNKMQEIINSIWYK